MGKKKSKVRQGIKIKKEPKGKNSIIVEVPKELKSNPDFIRNPLEYLKYQAKDSNGKKIDIPAEAFIRSAKMIFSNGQSMIIKK